MIDPAQSARRRAARNFAIGGTLFAAAVVAAIVASRPDPATARLPDPGYELLYSVRFVPAEHAADVEIEVTPGDGAVHEVRMRMPADRYTDVAGDGEVLRDGDTVRWTPQRDRPQRFHYRYRIDERHGDGGYDAMISADWAIVRGDDLVPPAATRTTKNADARARLRFELPTGWTTVDTPYERSREGDEFVVATANRSFDRPLGWIVAGNLGVRREHQHGTRLSVAGPVGEDIHRLDTLAFLNLLLPQYRKAFGELPPKLLVVRAGDPMWRGGLSGPRSLFLHASRPLLSENGTSTLAHEMTHVITRIRGAAGDDWFAEGLAEYYSIELSRRAGLITDERAAAALDWMRRHGEAIATLTADDSSGDRTARAVQLIAGLDREIRTRSDGKKSLDDLVRLLMAQPVVSRADLRAAVERLTGRRSDVLATPLLD